MPGDSSLLVLLQLLTHPTPHACSEQSNFIGEYDVLGFQISIIFGSKPGLETCAMFDRLASPKIPYQLSYLTGTRYAYAQSSMKICIE